MAEKDSDYLPSGISTDDEEDNNLVHFESTTIPTNIRSNKKSSQRRKKKKAPIRFDSKIDTVSSSENPASPMPQTPTSPTSPMSISSPFTFTQTQSTIVETSASSKLLFSLPKVERKNISIECKIDGNELKMCHVYVPDCNLLVNSKILQDCLSLMAVCKKCKIGNLQIFDNGKKASCATYLFIRCDNCLVTKGFWSVSGYFGQNKIIVGYNRIPKRNDLVYTSILGGRLVGLGLSQLETYHASLNIPLPPSNRLFREGQHSLLLAAEYLAENSMEKARYDLATYLGQDISEKYIHAVASYDGAYQQRSSKSGGGFSRYCFASAISVDIGKVLAYGVSCNSCSVCSLYENKLRDNIISSVEFKKWYDIHSSLCPATYSHLASVHLESAIAPQVVNDALKRGIIFSGLVCDGDNKSHDTIIESGIYQGITDNAIIRYECLSHVAKRMKTNLYKAQDRILKSPRKTKEFDLIELRKNKKHTESQIKLIVEKHKGKLVRDSRTRQEWNPTLESTEIRTISESVCAQIASYYRIAVQRNKGDTKEILKAIQAIPFHLGANNQNAEEYHKFCPSTSESWCKYQAAKASNRPLPNHPSYLSKNSVDLIMKVFEDFGYNTEEFISKISDGRTSNHNEAIHSILFRMVRKTELVGIDLMKLGSALAVIRYNDGFYGILALYQSLGIEISENMASVFSRMDTRRILASSRILKEQSKRYHKKQRRGVKTNKQIKKHGVGYQSGEYTAAKKLEFTESSESEDEGNISKDKEISTLAEPSPLVTEQLSEEEIEICQICKGTDEDEIVGFGLTIPEIDQEISWVCCTGCNNWYHLICLGLELDDISEKDWFCDNC